MRYMLMMHAPRGTGEYQVNEWTPDDLRAHIGFMHDLNRALTESGELVGAEGLAEARRLQHEQAPMTELGLTLEITRC